MKEITPQQPSLASLTVRDFKSLKDVTIQFGSVNVLVGANGSGKSNLLEALGVLGATVGGRVDDQALLRRGVRPGVPALYKSSFRGDRLANLIYLEARNSAGDTYYATITNPIQDPKPWWVIQHERLERPDGTVIASRGPRGNANILDVQLELENFTSVASLARANAKTPQAIRQLLDDLEDFAIFAPVTPVLRGIAPDTAPRNPVGLYGGQLPEALGLILNSTRRSNIRAVQHALDLVDWASGFALAEPSRGFLSPSVPTMRYVLRFTDKYMAAKRNNLSGYDASEGALYALFMIILAVHPQAPSLLAIDNFDQALNPRTARALTRFFVDCALKNGKQVVLTTHNPLVLDGLPLDDPRVRLFSVSRNRKRGGKTAVRRITVDLEAVRNRSPDQPLSQLWLMGRFGGMPNV